MQLPQLGRRAKPLKARQTLDDLQDLLITNPVDGDLLVYESSTQLWQNSKALTGDYTVTGSLSATTLTATGALTAATLHVSGAAVFDSSVTITGSLTAGATTLASLSVLGNASVAGTLTVTGTLAFAGFSVSGNGTIAGSLTIGTTLAVTGAATFASTVNITGLLTGSSAGFTGSVNIAGNLTVLGNISGATVSATTVSGVTGYFGTVNIGADVYTPGQIVFEDDGTSIDIYNGTLLSLSLDSVSIIEVTGVPTAAYANGSLALSTDGVVYVRSGSSWVPLVTDLDDVDFLLQDYANRQTLTITQELQTSDVNTDALYTDTIDGPLFKTTDYTQNGVMTGAAVKDKSGTFRPVGLAIWIDKDSPADETLTSLHVGSRIQMSTTPHALTTPSSADTDWPIGGWCTIVVGSSAPGSTIVAGDGITLAWFTGAAITTGTPRTLAIGANLTLYRKTATSFHIWGQGIS